MLRSLPLVLMLLFTGTSFAADRQQPVREWADNTGTYRISAQLLDADQQNQTVQLRLQTGEVVSLPLRRLSAVDRRYLNSLKSPKSPKSTRRTVRIAGINWFADLRDASQAATGEKSPQDDKPIMCFRALGDLSGFM